MKKYFITIILSLMVVSFTACAEKDEPVENKPVKEETTQEENEDELVEADENGGHEEVPEKISLNIYVVNPDDGTLMTEIKECEKVNEVVIWDFLKETGIIPEESKVLSLNKEENKLVLDVDNVFGERLRSQGTAGEQEILGCVANTFLDAYGCEGIKITEEGQVLLSGHAEYADYFTKF